MGITTEMMENLDKSYMFQKIAELPDQIREGWQIAAGADRPIDFDRIHSIVFAGMGGSAIAGDIIREFLGHALRMPFYVNREYGLPGFAGSGTLLIASSYSGNTEETLSAVGEGLQRGCDWIAVTSGGQLGETARQKERPLFVLPPGYPPRAALGYSLGVLLNLFSPLVPDLGESEIEATVNFLKDESGPWLDIGHHQNKPLALAETLSGRLPLLYTSVGPGEAVAMRWKAQINENAKAHVFVGLMPEMNHNEIMGWEQNQGNIDILKMMAPVMIRFENDHERVRLRMALTRRIIERIEVGVHEIEARGSNLLDQMLYLILFGDLVSFYMAILHGVNPTEIGNINALKKGLQSSQS
ncbi:MAG TPA: bifunctional phosphoglucose/phosphomannose isomerase [bacterium]|nr:bifunctional phosphoglucose/phosphomannose isomerase [bacterium]